MPKRRKTCEWFSPVWPGTASCRFASPWRAVSSRPRAWKFSRYLSAPFAPEDTVRLVRVGFPMLANFSDTLQIPQTILTARNDYLDKLPETSKRFLKALIQGIQLAKSNKAEAIKAGYDAKLQGEPEIVNPAYDLYAPAFSGDLSVNVAGLQVMLDEDKSNNLIDGKFTVDRVIKDRILKLAQQELRSEGRIK